MPRAANDSLPASAASFDTLPDSALIRQPTLELVLAVSPSTIWRLCRSGLLRPIKVTERSTAWRVGDVRAYLASVAAKVA